MKKRPFLLASLTIGAIFLCFSLIVLAVGVLSGRSLVMPLGDKIGILEVRGTIIDAQLIVDQVDNFRQNNAIKAVVLRIDSPGGGVAPSQEIHAELTRLAKEKPLIVSMGSVAASGGYYLAVAGEHLFANPGTITGSIGVIMSFPDYRELMGKVGVKTEVVKSCQYKDIGSSSRELSQADRELLQGMIDNVQAQFVQGISDGRDISLDRLRPYVDGRLLTGQQALAVGLIDELGTLSDAIRYAAKKVGLGDNPGLIYPEPEQTDFMDKLLQGVANRYLGVNLRQKISIGPQYLWNGY